MHSIHASSYYLPSTVEKSNDFFLNGASVPQKRHMLLSSDAEQEAKRHVGKCNRCRTEARDSMHGRQGASTASRGALALAAGGNSSGGTQQASRECISAGRRGGFSGWDAAGEQGVYQCGWTGRVFWTERVHHTQAPTSRCGRSVLPPVPPSSWDSSQMQGRGVTPSKPVIQHL